MSSWFRIVVVALGICAFALPGAAGAVTVSETLPFDAIIDNPCTMEPVLITGEVRVSMNATASAAGGTHLYTYFNYNDSTAVGMISGTKYQFNSEEKPAEFNDPAGPPATFWSVNSQEVVSLDKSPNFLTHLVIRFTVGPGYVPSADVTQVRITCSGQAEPVFP
jgi:hypothetical protein